MGWQEMVRRRLCADCWVAFSVLFEEVECNIPLHRAFRRAALDGQEKSIISARMRVFKNYLNDLKVDVYPDVRHRQGRGRYDYQESRVKLPIARGFLCGQCYGAVLQCASRCYCRKCQCFVNPLKYPLLVAA
jgi:hypothetical protein